MKIKYVNRLWPLPFPDFDEFVEKYFIPIEVTSDDYDVLISAHIDKEKIIPDKKRIYIFMTTEPDGVSPKIYIDKFDLITGFDFIDHPNYIRLPYAFTHFRSKIDYNYNRAFKCLPREKKYFACFLFSNGGSNHYHYSGVYDRNRLFHLLSLYKFVASGGKFLNNIYNVVPTNKTLEFISQCKFMVAYENDITRDGYITEKPYQAWIAGSLPLYNASSSVLSDINKDALIYRGDFPDEESFVEYIKKVDNDDQLYCEIASKNLIKDKSKNYSVFKEQLNNKLKQIFISKGYLKEK